MSRAAWFVAAEALFSRRILHAGSLIHQRYLLLAASPKQMHDQLRRQRRYVYHHHCLFVGSLIHLCLVEEIWKAWKCFGCFVPYSCSFFRLRWWWRSGNIFFRRRRRRGPWRSFFFP
jgi:hypothetical protein